MEKLSTNEIRNKWIEFFKSKQHLFVEPKSLIPFNDPSLLWINSGVATLKDYFTGIKNPPCNRLVNSQKSIRTNDIENVGVTARHHTFFEMLGNFSIGDYFKEEAIEFGYEFIFNVLKFNKSDIYITVYEEDTVTYNKWVSLGVSEKHILKCGRDRNFWDVGAGPCGPCTEIHYDRGKKYDIKGLGEELFFNDIENDRYVEIWNIVFSQYNNDGKNNYTELSRKNIDTGAGLERLACVIQDVPTNFDTDTFSYIIKQLENISGLKYDENAYFENDADKKEICRCYRVIVDHLKACVFAISDGAAPSGKERGSILRRLIRRSMVCARKIHARSDFINIVANAIVEQFKDFYPYLVSNINQVISILESERVTFEKTLENGLKLFETAVNNNSTMEADTIFKLVDTYGFPYLIIKELLLERNISFSEDEYFKKVEEHRNTSRANLDIKGMAVQATDLIALNVSSEFIYENYEMKDSTIIAMFDKNFNTIVNSTQECWLLLDKTCFYATSGGQIHDEGYIQIGNMKHKVHDVIKAPNNQHLHLIDPDGEKISVHNSIDLHVDIQFRKNVSSNHTTEHILEHVMNKYIDSSIKQEGAFKNDCYFTFDFKLNRRLNDDELKLIEVHVNEVIAAGNEVSTSLENLEEVDSQNTVGHFTDKYKKINGKLRVVEIKNVNRELCGGTHVCNTKDIEKFIIAEYTPKGTNSWRIRGITSNSSVSKYFDDILSKYKLVYDKLISQVEEFKIKDDEIDKIKLSITFTNSAENVTHIKNVIDKLQMLVKEKVAAKIKDNNKIAIANIKTSTKTSSKNGMIFYITVNNQDSKNVTAALNELSNEDKEHMFIIINTFANKFQYFIKNHKHFPLKANEVIKKINLLSGGSGGGNEEYAQGGSDNIYHTNEVIEVIYNYNS